MPDMVLSHPARTVLAKSVITGKLLRLPPLKPALYGEIDSALGLLGGKWNTRQQAHVFKVDPADMIAPAVRGETIIDQKKLFQEFYTPEVLAARVVKMAGVHGRSVLEPSAGNGVLADACLREGAASICCVEPRSESLEVLTRKGHRPRAGDFLKFYPLATAGEFALGFFERIVMNPPFSKGAAVAHVRHALRFLRPDGILVSIVPVQGCGVDDVEKFLPVVPRGFEGVLTMLPAGSFKASGTNVKTATLRIAPSLDHDAEPTLRFEDPYRKTPPVIVRSTPTATVEEHLDRIMASLKEAIAIVQELKGDSTTAPLTEISEKIESDLWEAEGHLERFASLSRDPSERSFPARPQLLAA